MRGETESDLHYRRLFEAARSGIIILDAETGMIINVNPYLIEMLGYTRKQFIKKAIWEIGLFRNIAANRENFLELQKNEHIRYEDLPLETADGRQIDVEFISNVYLVNNHKFIQCNIRDISERRRSEETAEKAEREMSRSNRDLEQFAFVTSHDLQEPLRAVTGFMGLLKKEYGAALDENARDYINKATEGTDRMRNLIQNLLAFSMVDRRMKPLIQVDMGDALKAAVENLSLAISESGAVVTGGRLPVITGDFSQMVQLLQNLIANAIKFKGPDPPVISINALEDDGKWSFSVSDNGIGIDPVNSERIFVVFQRLHSRTDYDGTGIGLAVCKKIVERHGGSIRVESIAGRGSVFYFTIKA